MKKMLMLFFLFSFIFIEMGHAFEFERRRDQFNKQYGLNLGNNSTIRCNIRTGNRISIKTGP